MPQEAVAEDPSDLVILAWLFVLFELDAIFWVLVIRALLSI